MPAALRFTVLEAVLSYAYCYRLFSGAPCDDAADAAAAALALSCALRGALHGAHASADEAPLRGHTPHPEQCPRSAAAPPRVAPDGFGRRATPRERGRATGGLVTASSRPRALERAAYIIADSAAPDHLSAAACR